MDNNMPVISAKNLNLWYGDFKALKGISLDVGEQEITALIGPSGCGKSTFLKTLNRMNDLIPGVKITGAKTRFGSCNSRNSLCFSWRLMQYPDEAIDLVVVHELCHIAHHDHGPGFYALLGSILPDHRERMKLLRG